MKFVQHNVNRTREVLFSILEISLENKVDILLLQELYTLKISGQYIIIQYSVFYTISPELNPSVYRPRVLMYIRKNAKIQFNFRYNIYNDLDIQIIKITGIEEPFLIYNIYNKKQQTITPATATANSKPLHIIERFLLNNQIIIPTLLAENFNLYHT